MLAFFVFIPEIFYVYIGSNFFRNGTTEYYFHNFGEAGFIVSLIPLTTWLISSYTLVNAIYNRYLYFKPERKSPGVKERFSGKPRFLDWPMENNLQLVIGEVYDSSSVNRDPEWLVMDNKGLYTGLIVFGATGTGKTSACAYPYLEQLASFKSCSDDEKIGGLMLDVKGDFWRGALDIIEKTGRLDDVVIIEPGSGYYFNPVHYPDLDSRIIAERLYSVLENMNSNDGRQDSYWKDKSINLLANSISLIRTSLGYVTLDDIYEIISDENRLDELLEHGKNLLESKNTKSYASGVEEEIRIAVNFFAGSDYKGLDERTRGIIKSESLRVCSDFIKNPYRDTFCAPLEKLNFKGFKDVINSGKIILLRMPESKYGITGRTIGIMLKLDYFRTVLNRVYSFAAGSGINMKRPVMFICDEYQNFVTSGNIESDEEFFARCRQSKAINIVLTQSYSSLKLKLGSEEKLNSLIGNLRSALWLSLADDYSREKASRICDKEYRLKITENITEQDEGATFNPYIGGLIADDNTLSQGTTRTFEKTPYFDTDDFAKLKLNQAVYRIYSGGEMKGPGIVYLHPVYRPKGLSYFS